MQDRQNTMNTNNILKWAMYIGLFFIPFVPLIVANSLFFPFIVGKNFAFRIVVEIVLALWLVLYVRKGIEGPGKTWVLYSILALTIVSILATLNSEVPYRSLWSNYERMDGLISFLHLGAYFLVISSVFNTKRLWELYFNVSLLGAFAVSIKGFLQLIARSMGKGGIDRIDSTLGNAIYLAVYLMINIFIALYLCLGRKGQKVWQGVYIALMLVFSVVLYNTATRGAILGLFGGLLVTLFFTSLSGTAKVKKYALISVAVIVLGSVGLYFARNSAIVSNSPVLRRFALISLADSTTRTRFIVWGIALKGVAERPFLGWGQESFNIVFNKYFDARLHSQETWFDRAHNVYLDWLVSTGILGLVAYLGIYLAVIWTLFKNLSISVLSVSERNVLLGLFSAYFFQSIFVFDNLVGSVFFLTMVGFVHFASERQAQGALASKLSNIFDRMGAFIQGSLAPVVQAILVIAMIFAVYTVNVKPIRANQLMLTNMFGPRNISAERLVNIKKLFALNTFGSMEAREQLIFLLIELRGQPGLDEDLMSEYLNLAVAQMSEQLKVTGTDARHQLFMGSFLQSFGKPAESVVYYKNALALSPNKQLTLFSLSRVSQDLGDSVQALAYAKQAYDLEPKYTRALNEYVIALIYDDKKALASELLIKVYGTDLIVDARMIEAYARTGSMNKVVAIWQEQIKQNPDNDQAYISLAATYYAKFEDAKAIQTLRTLQTRKPELADQIKVYIDQISSGTLPR